MSWTRRNGKIEHLILEQHRTWNKWNRNESTALGRPVITRGRGVVGGLNRFYGAPTFTLIFRRGLLNLIGCSARTEVS